MELGERAVEAQACYSLGNTYTLLRDFPTAIDYHQRHLAIAQELGDKIGEARACWSLGNAHAAIGTHEKALHYAQLHLFLAKDLGDPVGEATARINIADLKKVLNVPDSQNSDTESLVELQQKLMQKNQNTTSSSTTGMTRQHRLRRQSMEQLDLIKLTPDSKKQQSVDLEHIQAKNQENNKPPKEEDFFEFLTRTQSKRMDDQRCTLKSGNEKDRRPLVQQNNNSNKDQKRLLEMIADFQSKRMDEQRCELLPGYKRSEKNADLPPIMQEANAASGDTKAEPDEPFFDMLMRSQSSRYDEQRSELPITSVVQDVESNDNSNVQPRREGVTQNRTTLPDEDFFSLIMRVQGGRMEDQRATVPLNRNQNSNSK